MNASSSISSSKNGSLFVIAILATTTTLLGGWLWSQQQQKENEKKKQVGVADNGQKKEQNQKSKHLKLNKDMDDAQITTHNDEKKEELDADRRILSKGRITIVHGSVTGTCKKFAEELYARLAIDHANTKNIRLGSVEQWDWWDELLNQEQQQQSSSSSDDNNEEYTIPKLILLLPTYTNGTWPPNAANTLQAALNELNNDWRIEKFPLKKKLHVSVFGMGSSEYDDVTIVNDEEEDSKKEEENNDDTIQSIKKKKKIIKTKTMGKPAKDACILFQKLGAKLINGGGKLLIGDDSIPDHATNTFEFYTQRILQVLEKQKNLNLQDNNKKQQFTKKQLQKQIEEEEKQEQKEAEENGFNFDDEDDDDEDYDDYDDDDEEEETKDEPKVMDLEDIGDAMARSSKNANKKQGTEPREMVTKSQAKALKKEGYKLIGTHSAVKLCRWTKHQLRGRGGCYKHTFYGITSYSCMEATPSLACANKCVFCWRHHKNPVGKEWKWKTDDPKYIVDEAMAAHLAMIKETKGIPGIKYDRWLDAHTIRHCALSLVGEPIMYPHINELLNELHKNKISTYLVTNGQHPNAIEKLLLEQPITQLYVSIDAPTQTSLIEIDRPLFNDAWERLQLSLETLKKFGTEAHQRTVARLTVVKGWNMSEIQGYAKLIALGNVSLIEIKGVTFCGKSDASNLNMSNTPWHHEVIQFAKILQNEIEILRKRQKEELQILQQQKSSTQQQQKQQPETKKEENKNEVDIDKVFDIGNKNNAIIPEYDFACEHKHSCSVLLARVDQFAFDVEEEEFILNDNGVTTTKTTTTKRKWKTWIDYEKFNFLVTRYMSDPTNKDYHYTIQDYCAETPAWALFGSNEEGFDPTDMRHYKKKKHPKYTQYDDNGIPTHDENNEELSSAEREKLQRLMDEKIIEIQQRHEQQQAGVKETNNRTSATTKSSSSSIVSPTATVITNVMNDGAKEIHDARLMFRGLVVTK